MATARAPRTAPAPLRDVRGYWILRSRYALVADDAPDFVEQFIRERYAEEVTAVLAVLTSEVRDARADEFVEWWTANKMPAHRDAAAAIWAGMYEGQERDLRVGVDVTRHRPYSGTPYTVRVRPTRGTR